MLRSTFNACHPLAKALVAERICGCHHALLR